MTTAERHEAIRLTKEAGLSSRTGAPVLLDLAMIDGPVYTGRDRGELLRSEWKLDELDASGRPIHIHVPESTYTLSSSFFLGLFGPSVVKAGSKRAFVQRYEIDAPDYLKEAMDSYIARALATRSLIS